MRRERVIASLLGLLLLTGCSPSTWKAYAGEKLPNNQTALIESRDLSFFGSTTVYRFVSVDGQEIPKPLSRYAPLAPARPYRPIRVLPGRRDLVIEGGRPVGFIKYRQEHVIIDAEAGTTYNVQWKRNWNGATDYLWVLDETGAVVAGETPPAE